MFVVGTVGHVDHGKSTLVQALTGMDPDRLPVEKQRGMTTDLGFAWLTLPSGRDVSVVDVPGHERYIKNMLAGSGSVDLALIVIAADDGPMMQTREHVAIIELLEVPTAICVITKTDIVEADYLELVDAEIEETLARTTYASAPRVRVSAKTGDGLAELLRVIDETLANASAKQDTGVPRLPIDRVFTVRGFGTVVTGTLVGGRLEAGQEIELQPGGLRGRIRGLQRHATEVSSAEPGTRLAVNLTGEAGEAAQRGMVLARPGSVQVASIVDLQIRVPATIEATLRHNQGVTLLCGTAESEGRLRLLEGETIWSGHDGWGQVVLDTPLAMNLGDRCIIRTPNETVAGGLVVALNPHRHRRDDPDMIAALELQAEGSAEDRMLELLISGPRDRGAIPAALALTAAEVDGEIATLREGGSVGEDGTRVFAAAWLAGAIRRTLEATKEFLTANSLRASAPREHLRSVTKLDGPSFDLVVRKAVEQGALVESAQHGFAVPGHAVTLAPRIEAAITAFRASLLAGGYSPPTENLPEPAILAYLVERDLVVDTGKGVVYDHEVFTEMTARLVAWIDENGPIGLAEARDLFATTRKYAQPFLEQLDALKVTRRLGEKRVILRRP